ncbi:MAG TPA: 16S rRNA (guanine(966)-N(2))-methyltransferase RsmD [Terriglobales bacterium]|nr:16S rRNA (guanine(966)-N(2))-methyltransferase RsmD [Terriglobales bacterium]
MRVIAGKYRSRVLRSLRGLDLRPTADRLRETLFDVLTAGNPAALEGTVWLDLFAGTGAVGIESLSRGAEKVYFVEASARAGALIESNLQSLGIMSGFQIVKQDAVRTIHGLSGNGVRAGFVFLDPPYRMQQAYANTLEALSASHILKPSSIVIAEHHKKFDPPAEVGSLRRYRLLQQGDAALSFYRLAG